jgi:hypothetical protein
MNKHTWIIYELIILILIVCIIFGKNTSEVTIKQNDLKYKQSIKIDSLEIQVNDLQKKMDEIYLAFKAAE